MATLADLNPAVMTAIDRLDYRATVGDVATESGLNVAIAQIYEDVVFAQKGEESEAMQK